MLLFHPDVLSKIPRKTLYFLMKDEKMHAFAFFNKSKQGDPQGATDPAQKKVRIAMQLPINSECPENSLHVITSIPLTSQSLRYLSLFQKLAVISDIIPLLSWIKTEKKIYLLFKYYNAPDVGAYIKNINYNHKNKQVNELNKRLIIFRSAKALEQLHSWFQIIHGDIKPSNLFITLNKKGAVIDIKIGDIPFASENQVPPMTPVYAPPEIHAARRCKSIQRFLIAPSIDVWALGCVFYKLLKGPLGWERPIKISIGDLDVKDPLPLDFTPIAGSPTSSEEMLLIQKMLCTNPKERISMSDVVKKLSALWNF